MSDHSNVTITAGSEPELQALLQGLLLKHPDLDTSRLRVRSTSVPGEVQVYVAAGGQS